MKSAQLAGFDQRCLRCRSEINRHHAGQDIVECRPGTFVRHVDKFGAGDLGQLSHQQMGSGPQPGARHGYLWYRLGVGDQLLQGLDVLHPRRVRINRDEAGRHVNLTDAFELLAEVEVATVQKMEGVDTGATDDGKGVAVGPGIRSALMAPRRLMILLSSSDGKTCEYGLRRSKVSRAGISLVYKHGTPSRACRHQSSKPLKRRTRAGQASSSRMHDTATGLIR